MSFYLLIAFLVFLCSSMVTSDLAASNITQKVAVDMYYESLCPLSADFITNELAKVFQEQDLFSIIDLRLSPWGNAQIGEGESFSCQHGESECLLNTIEACAISIWPDVNQHFPLISCIETSVQQGQSPHWETCCQTLGFDSNAVSDCYSNGLGNQLEMQYAAQTPPHQFVPWVVVDGQPINNDYENFVHYVCKAYNGSAVPGACRVLSLAKTRN
ncbi:Gamma-interferon-responsive lysosomal thiol protein-like protein [Drosera capensis]